MTKYVTTLFGDVSYLEGVVLVALGLIRQGSIYDRICLITETLALTCRPILEKFFTHVLVVGIISAEKKAHIRIDSRILSKIPCGGDINGIYMTKLHIFNKSLLNYDKVVYIDSDLIPIQKFDALFSINAPAGWLEANNGHKHVWGAWTFKKTKYKIPKSITDLMNPLSFEINTGLLVIEPNDSVFRDMIHIACNSELLNQKFWGYFEHRNRLVKGYSRTDQQFITQYFSGRWTYISEKYNVWDTAPLAEREIYGLHMAGVSHLIADKKSVGGRKRIYGKTWMIQPNDEKDIYVRTTNELIAWGIKKYPFLCDFFYKKLNIIIADRLVPFKILKPEQCNESLKVISFLINPLQAVSKDLS